MTKAAYYAGVKNVTVMFLTNLKAGRSIAIVYFSLLM